MLQDTLDRFVRTAARTRPDTASEPVTDVRLGTGRIFILPTRFGIVFAVLLFAMLLGAMNYGANLAFLLTFLLAGLALVSMRHCHHNLRGLRVRFAGARPVFVGEAARFGFALANDSARDRFEVELDTDGRGSSPVDIPSATTQALSLRVPALVRGRLTLDRVTVRTLHPGRLFRAWAPVSLQASCLVYPAPAPAGRPLPRLTDGSRRTPGRDRADEDFSGFRPAQPSDPPRRIAWKAYARNGELLLKEFSGSESETVVLDWDGLAELDTEARLSQLTRWCLDAAAASRRFSLILPGQRIGPGHGRRHLEICLAALALFRSAPQRKTG